MVKPEGTYLVWVDCSKLNMNPKKLRTSLLINRLALDDGECLEKKGNNFKDLI